MVREGQVVEVIDMTRAYLPDVLYYVGYSSVKDPAHYI